MITSVASLVNESLERGTFGSAGSVALQRHALLVVIDPQHAALLCARRLRRAFSQDHPDLPAVRVQVSPLPHVHVLSDLLGKTVTRGDAAETRLENGRIHLCWTEEKGI